MGLDARLLRAMRTRCHGPRLERAAVAYSRLGEHGALWFGLGAAGLAIDRPRRSLYTRLLRVLTAGVLCNYGAKLVVRRERPPVPALTDTLSRLSYPSAHATTSFAAARVLSRELPPAPLYAAAAAMAATRPYLGVHYPSDAVAGAALGTALAELVP